MDDAAFRAWLARKSWAQAARYCRVVAWLLLLAVLAIDLPLLLRGTFAATPGADWRVAWQAVTAGTCIAVLAIDRRLVRDGDHELPLTLLCGMFMLLTTWSGVRGVLLGGGGLTLYAAGSTFIAAAIPTPRRVRRPLYLLSLAAIAAAAWWKRPELQPLLTALVVPFCVVVLCLELDRHSYSHNRALFTQHQRAEAERARADAVLYNVLPAAIADELKREDKVDAVKFENLGVLFADIAGFTSYSRTLPPNALVLVLDEIFSSFDGCVERHGLEKIKTIGDAYMVVSYGDVPALCALALDLRGAIAAYNRANGTRLAMRIGIHVGPAVAGVIGVKRFLYDVWGDTVNVASRMEESGAPDAIHVTDAVREQAGAGFAFSERTAVEIRGRGPMRTWWLTGAVEARPPVQDAHAVLPGGVPV